jgi:hypothetical protein
MIPYPWRSLSAKASKMCSTAGVSGSRSRGSRVPSIIHVPPSPYKQSQVDISAVDTIPECTGVIKERTRLAVWVEVLAGGLQRLLTNVGDKDFRDEECKIYSRYYFARL